MFRGPSGFDQASPSPRSDAASEPGSTSSMCSGRIPIVNVSLPSSAPRGCTVTGRASATGSVSTRSSPE